MSRQSSRTRPAPGPSLIISCDWGTTTFRLRIVQTNTAAVLAERRTAEGVQVLAQASATPAARAAAFRATLLRHILAAQQELGVALARTPVLVSGMASSSIGWRELPYAPLPFPLDGSGLVVRSVARLTLPGTGPVAALPVWLFSGMAGPADIARGEEMEAIGILSRPELAAYRDHAVLVLPGTHAKHLRVERGQITDFRTFMTGELLAVLSGHSVLRHSVLPPPADGPDVAGSDEDLCAGVRDAARLPLTHALFRVRTRHVLERIPSDRNTAYLTGLLVGSELDALRQAWPATPILLCAGARQAGTYLRACAVLGLGERVVAVPPAVVDHGAVLGHLMVCARKLP